MHIKLENCVIKVAGEIILKEVTFEVSQGTFYRITGDNGSGKSVFLTALLGINKDVKGNHRIDYKKSEIAYIPEAPFFMEDDSVNAVVNLLSFLYARKKSETIDILALLNIDFSTVKFNKISTLSTGMKKKLCLVPIFYTGINLFFLDEVFVGLDAKTQDILMKKLIQLHQEEKTIICIEHQAVIMETLKKELNIEEYICQNQTLQYD